MRILTPPRQRRCQLIKSSSNAPSLPLAGYSKYTYESSWQPSGGVAESYVDLERLVFLASINAIS